MQSDTMWPMDAMGIDIGGSSVKLAALSRQRGVLWTSQSQPYSRPDRQQLLTTIQSAFSARNEAAANIPALGLCVPGILDSTGNAVVESINVPGLIGMPLKDLIQTALGESIPGFTIVNDAWATGADVVISRQLAGRVMVIALGTGVGMAVLDGADRPILIDGASPGHIGQFDVSLESDSSPIGPDGGAGSLEAYIGTPALIAQYGNMENFFKSVSAADAPIRALARAIRICHAIYRPDHLVLAGGIGVRLSSIIDGLKGLIDTNLTRIARKEWTLSCAQHDFHAAIGAARAALGKQK